jgi:large subunit ribosomal protein L32
MRHTRSHTKNRRSHHALVATAVVKDKESGSVRLPHRLDELTGMYRGKQIVAPKVKKEKAAGKNKAASVLLDPETQEHAHEKHEHAHENADKTRPRGFFGRVGNARPKARSGTGGDA